MNPMVLTFVALIGIAPDSALAPPAECTCPPGGMVLVPAEVAAKFLLDINRADEGLQACRKEVAKWQTRNDCT